MEPVTFVVCVVLVVVWSWLQTYRLDSVETQKQEQRLARLQWVLKYRVQKSLTVFICSAALPFSSSGVSKMVCIVHNALVQIQRDGVVPDFVDSLTQRYMNEVD